MLKAGQLARVFAIGIRAHYPHWARALIMR
jgi:hypothetical protein